MDGLISYVVIGVNDWKKQVKFMEEVYKLAEEVVMGFSVDEKWGRNLHMLGDKNEKKNTWFPMTRASVANKILNSCYSLSAVEKRIVLLTLGSVKGSEKLDCTKWYGFRVEDYANLVGTTTQHAYEILKEEHLRLFNRSITIKGEITPTSERHFRWVQSIRFAPDTCSIELQWSDGIIPFISELKGKFTSLGLEEILSLNSVYANRLYEFVIQQRYKGLSGEVWTTVDEIRDRWYIPESGKEYKYLRSYILLPAIEELWEKELVAIRILTKEKRNIKNIGFEFRFFQEADWKSIKENKQTLVDLF